MAYHIHLTKRIQTLIRNRTGKQPSCCFCGKVFEIGNEFLSLPKKNFPTERQYACFECYREQPSKEVAEK